VLKRLLYRALGKFASICFNILNVFLAGNLPPLGCACVIVEEQGRYLVLRRPEGELVFPGGYMRWREHPTHTAQREFKEETGLQVHLHDVIGCYPKVSTHFGRMSTLTLAYCGKVAGGEMRGGIEGEPCWIDGPDLRSMLSYQYRCCLDDYLEHRKQHAEQKILDLAEETGNG
jgi:ADP-ribose pyrophosphatase YjhB (NUDIX family)